MTALFRLPVPSGDADVAARETVRFRAVDPADPREAARIGAFLAAHREASAFHRPQWLAAVADGTGQRGWAMLAEIAGELVGYLPLTEVHSPLFGRLLASSGFAVGGGLLRSGGWNPGPFFTALEELALRLSCTSIELRGGVLPADRRGWTLVGNAHAGFCAALAGDDERQLAAVPRKQRAELRKGLAAELAVSIGRNREALAAHYAVYAESLRNLGTPVFPRGLFAAVLAQFGEDADILTVHHRGRPVASVLSLYHRGTVLPYWGGGTTAARALRANDRMYFALMSHARGRGCERFDFGRSKAGSGAWHFKRNWGFEPQPLTYARWTAPGSAPRDADPRSARHAARIALWQRLPLALANRLGPPIARGLG